MPPKKILQYEEEVLLNALDDVARGMPVYATAKKYGIPRSTIRSKVKGINPISRKMGAHSTFTSTEELLLENWVVEIAKRGFLCQSQRFCSVSSGWQRNWGKNRVRRRKKKRKIKSSSLAMRLQKKKEQEEEKFKQAANRQLVFNSKKRKKAGKQEDEDSEESDLVCIHSSRSSSGGEWEENTSTDADLEMQAPEMKIGEYVAISYDGNFFPALILELKDGGAIVTAMVRNGRLWKWPAREDRLFYS